MDMYMFFDGKSRKLIEIHILGENYNTKQNIWVIMTKKLIKKFKISKQGKNKHAENSDWGINKNFWPEH